MKLIKTMENKGLINKIGTIQDKIPSLVKDEKNKHQNYKYFEESQLLKILKPLLKEEKLTMIITDDDSQPQQYERESNKHFLRYLKQMEISDRETGESKIYKFWACGDNTDLAKAKGSAETYAMKYILSKFWLIRVVDEDEPDRKKDDNDIGGGNKTTSPAETEKKRIMEKVILKEDGWYYCKRCGEVTGREFKLIEKHPNLKLNELKEALLKHGELTTRD